MPHRNNHVGPKTLWVHSKYDLESYFPTWLPLNTCLLTNWDVSLFVYFLLFVCFKNDYLWGHFFSYILATRHEFSSCYTRWHNLNTFSPSSSVSQPDLPEDGLTRGHRFLEDWTSSSEHKGHRCSQCSWSRGHVGRCCWVLSKVSFFPSMVFPSLNREERCQSYVLRLFLERDQRYFLAVGPLRMPGFLFLLLCLLWLAVTGGLLGSLHILWKRMLYGHSIVFQPFKVSSL